MLLKILQCTGQHSQQKFIWTKMLIVPRLRNLLDSITVFILKKKYYCLVKQGGHFTLKIRVLLHGVCVFYMVY